MEQGTPEWHAARAGRVTASRLGDMLAKTKSGWGAGRRNYLAELVAERLTGTVADTYVSGPMQWGREQEAAARTAYTLYFGKVVEPAGFVSHPGIRMSGASPDGFVGDAGLVEFKCPNTATHIDTLLGAKIDSSYIMQMQWQMACTSRQWCDWCSYDPRMPEELKMHRVRVARDDRHIEDLTAAVTEFLAEVDAKEEALRQLIKGQEAA